MQNYIRYSHLFKRKARSEEGEWKGNVGILPAIIQGVLDGTGPITTAFNKAKEAYLLRRQQKIADRGITKEQLEFWVSGSSVYLMREDIGKPNTITKNNQIGV